MAGTLKYTGSANGSSDRAINLTGATGGAGTLDASGSAAFALSGGVTSAGTSGTTVLMFAGSGIGSQSGVIANGAGTNVTAVSMNGAGTWTLGGDNTFTGGLSINSGTIALGNAGALNAANPNAVTLAGNGGLWINGRTITISDLISASGNAIVENGNATPVTLTIDKASGSSTYAGVPPGRHRWRGAVACGRAGAGSTDALQGQLPTPARRRSREALWPMGVANTLAAGPVTVNGGTRGVEPGRQATMIRSARSPWTAGRQHHRHLHAHQHRHLRDEERLGQRDPRRQRHRVEQDHQRHSHAQRREHLQPAPRPSPPGKLVVAANQAMGTNAGGATVADGATLGFQGNINYSATEALGIRGSGVGGVGAIENLSGNNSFAGAITLSAAGTIGSTAGTLTLTGGISGGGNVLTFDGSGATAVSITAISGTNTTLTKNGGGTLALIAANTYTGKTAISGGTLSINTIQNAGSATANSLGRPAAGADSIIDLSGTLKYTGSASGATDRVINLAGAAGGAGTLEASGIATFALSGGVTSAGTSGTTALTLTGSGNGSQSGIIANGTGSNVTTLTKLGGGTWTLSGGNTYTGLTTVQMGRLAITSAGAIGGNATVNGGGTLVVNAAANIDSGGGKSVTVNEGGILSVDSDLNPNAMINPASTGIVALNANNSTLAGINGSSAFLGALGAFSYTGPGTLSPGSGSTYRLGGGGGTLTFTQPNVITGGNAVLVGSNQPNGGGTVVFAAAQNYTGDTTVAAGKLSILSAASITSNVSVNNGGTLGVNAAGNLTGGKSVIINPGGILSVDSNINPSAMINPASTGIVALNVNNTALTGVNGSAAFLGSLGSFSYTGTTALSAGSGSIYRLGGGGGTLTFTQPSIITGGNDVLIGSGQAHGEGTVVFSNAQDYTGVTTIDVGTLGVGGANGTVLGSPSFTVRGGATLLLDSSAANKSGTQDRIANTAGVTVAGGTVRLLGSSAANSTETVGTLTVQPGAGIVTVTRGGGRTATLTFGSAGVDSLSRTAAGGTVNFSFTVPSAEIISTPKLARTNGIIGGYATVNSEWASLSADNGNVQALATYETSPNPANWANAENVRPTGSTTSNVGTATINSLNVAGAYTMTQNAGTMLTFASGGILANPGTGNTATITGGTLTSTNIAAGNDLIIHVNSGTLAVASAVADTTAGMGLTKTGSGRLALSNTHEYTGPTNVNGGILQISGSIAASSGVFIHHGGRLEATGALPAVTVNDGGTIAPGIGDSVANLTSAGQTWADGASYEWEIASPAGSPGTDWDHLQLGASALDLDAEGFYTVNIVSVDATGAAGPLSGFDRDGYYRWTIATAGSISGFDSRHFLVDASGFTNYNDIGGGSFSIIADGQHLQVLYVPEPSSMLLLGAMGAALLAKRRRTHAE